MYRLINRASDAHTSEQTQPRWPQGEAGTFPGAHRVTTTLFAALPAPRCLHPWPRQTSHNNVWRVARNQAAPQFPVGSRCSALRCTGPVSPGKSHRPIRRPYRRRTSYWEMPMCTGSRVPDDPPVPVSEARRDSAGSRADHLFNGFLQTGWQMLHPQGHRHRVRCTGHQGYRREHRSGDNTR